MLITKYTSFLVQSSKKTAMVSPSYYHPRNSSNNMNHNNSGHKTGPSSDLPLLSSMEDEEVCCDVNSGDAFLEPYMQGLAGDFGNPAFAREIFRETSTTTTVLDCREIDITDGVGTAADDRSLSQRNSGDGDLVSSSEDTGRCLRIKNNRPFDDDRRCLTSAHSTSISPIYDPDENVEDQIVPLLASPSIASDLPDTPVIEDEGARFKLVRVNTKPATGTGSLASLNQLTSGDECSTASSTTNSSLEEEETPCDITLLERLIRTHPIWFLPGIQRAGAFHLLQGKEDGNFVVRQSSQTSTMAISVRLPSGKGPYIEHYLIQGGTDGQIGLESSDNKFASIPLLIAHYCQCCDELPVQLTLPRAIREAKNRQQLSSLALLGQEFWRYPMANPRNSVTSVEVQVPATMMAKDDASTQSDSTPSSSSNSPASSLSSFDSGTGNNHNNTTTTNNNNNNNTSGMIELSSSGLELDSSNSLQSSEPSSQPTSLMTTFKGSPPFNNKSPHNQIGIPVSSECTIALPVETSHITSDPHYNVRKPRPTPPNTLNLISTVSTVPVMTASGLRSCHNTSINSITSSSSSAIATPAITTSLATPQTNKTPPPPPPRWAKPVSGNVCATNSGNGQQNFTVTTTLTFSVNNKESSPPPQVQVACIQISSPIPHEKDEFRSVSVTHIHNSAVQAPTTSPSSVAAQSNLQVAQNTITTTPASVTHSSLTSQCSQTSSSTSQQPQILSPVSEGNTRPFHKRNRRHRLSRHYQESDILESAVTYHRSTVADKISDYEDIWGPDSSLSTFKPASSTPKPTFTPADDFPAKTFNRSISLESSPSDITLHHRSITGSSSAITSPIEIANINRNRLDLASSSVPLNNSSGSASFAAADIKSPSESVTSPVESKQPSPFYAEPADAIRHQNNAFLRKKVKSNAAAGQQAANNRHSDPTLLHQWPQVGCSSNLERIDSKEELITNNGLSSSMDNLISLRNSRRFPGIPNPLPKSVKPVDPPKIGPTKKTRTDNIWPVDSSWEFIGHDVDDLKLGYDAESACKSLSPQSETKQFRESSPGSSLVSSYCQTVQDIISQRFPKLSMSPIYLKVNSGLNNIANNSNSSGGDSDVNNAEDNESSDKRLSISDNILGFADKSYLNGFSVLSQISDNSDDTQTEFSEPWDSSNWEHLLPKLPENSDNIQSTSVRLSSSKSFKERLDPLLSPPRLKALARVRAAGGIGSSPGASVRAYAFQLAADKSTVFAQSIDNFIACTKESRETRPQVVMRNMRQFMSGMKNYLLKHGEGEFEKEVEKERTKLKANEFMNLDAILEGVMLKLVVIPLKDHLYNLFVAQYTESGSIQQLTDNIIYARTRRPQEIGLREKIIPPSEEDLRKIFECFRNLQLADSPLDKLEHLLSAIANIFHSAITSEDGIIVGEKRISNIRYTGDGVSVSDSGGLRDMLTRIYKVKVLNKGAEPALLGADDFLPLFIWVLVQSGMIAAEIEAEYMWGLLHPSLLSGEGGYYLTTLSSAVSVLKNFKQCIIKETNPSITWRDDSLTEFRSVLKVVVPDEMNGSLITRTLPVRPNMTTRDICKIIALKLRITNPQDYSLFKLVDGEETLLNDFDSPQDIKSDAVSSGKHCIFAYKRSDAKIAWPTSPTQD